MKTISNHIRMSAFSLVLPALFNAYSASAYASLIDISQSQAYGSEPAALGSVLAGQELPYQTAAVHFIADEYGKKQFNGGSSQSAQDFTTEGLCANAGYRIKSCPSGYVKGEACPDDGSFVRECIDPESWCRGNGYTVTKCEVPSYPAEACPHSSAYYRSCQDDNIRACKEAGYSLTCETGKVGDNAQVCPYNSSYKKCVCNPCKGYDYTAEQANAQGYLPGDVCNSCGSAKYKRTANPCDGFKECNCGGETDAKICWNGTIKKFETCKECCDSKYKYDSSNCSNGKILAGNSCGGKYDICQAPAKVGDILYGDGTTTSELVSGKTPIGVVFDTENRLALALTNVKRDGSAGTQKYSEESMFWDTYMIKEEAGTEWKYCTKDNLDSCGSNRQYNTAKLISLNHAGSTEKAHWAIDAIQKFEPDGCSEAFCRKTKWLLPSAKDLKLLCSKDTNSLVRKSLELMKNIGAVTKIYDYWSSTMASASYVWAADCILIMTSETSGYCSDQCEMKMVARGSSLYVRPVVQF